MFCLSAATTGAETSDTYQWNLPPGFSAPRTPPENPMSAARVALGKHLFFEPKLSGSGEIACASCHRPELAFSDALPHSIGADGDSLATHTMSLVNLAYRSRFGWRSPGTSSLEAQLHGPLFNQHPVEMGARGHETKILRALAGEGDLSRLHADAFPDRPMSFESIVLAIASYERSLISGNSAFDRWVFAGESPGASVIRGFNLFTSPMLACSDCHRGLNLSNEAYLDIRADGDDILVPGLRNIELTAPYFHDGSLDSLDRVIEHYATGPNADLGLKGFKLSASEQQDLKAFLRSLTDHEFISRHSETVPGQ